MPPGPSAARRSRRRRPSPVYWERRAKVLRPARHQRHWPQVDRSQATPTRSPMRESRDVGTHRVATRPRPRARRHLGPSGWRSPAARCKSVRQIPHAVIRTSTSPDAGSRSDRDTRRSLAPGASLTVTTQANISLSFVRPAGTGQVVVEREVADQPGRLRCPLLLMEGADDAQRARSPCQLAVGPQQHGGRSRVHPRERARSSTTSFPRIHRAACKTSASAEGETSPSAVIRVCLVVDRISIETITISPIHAVPHANDAPARAAGRIRDQGRRSCRPTRRTGRN